MTQISSDTEMSGGAAETGQLARSDKCNQVKLLGDQPPSAPADGISGQGELSFSLIIHQNHSFIILSAVYISYVGNRMAAALEFVSRVFPPAPPCSAVVAECD